MRSALEKINRQEAPTATEIKVLNYLGNRFIWKPAFTSEQLFGDFKEVLTRNNIVAKTDIAILNEAEAFVSLYALSVMHGSTIVLDDTNKARLYAGFANRDGFLEIKVEILFSELSKPLMAPVCLFLTDLRAEGHCDPDLGASADTALFNSWNFPIDIDRDNRLCRIR